VSDCYLSWRQFWGKADTVTTERELLASQFAASATLIVIPAILEGGSTGLIVFDRVSQRAKLIHEERARLLAPFLSIDGQRLLFLRRHTDGTQRDIVSCSVDSWQCHVVVRTEDTVFSPTELSKDVVVYTSSPLVTGFDKRQRYSRNDVIAVTKAGKRYQLTNLGYYDLDSICITNHSIFLSGSNGPYEIFRSELPQLTGNAIEPLHPSVFLGPSTTPIYSVSASFDGQLVSFAKAEILQGKYSYNLNVVSGDGKPLGMAKVNGIAMSRGSFIEHDLVFNELYSDRYVVKQWDVANNSFAVIAEIQHEPSQLMLLERISLVTNEQ
jgi:hypothetical protein